MLLKITDGRNGGVVSPWSVYLFVVWLSIGLWSAGKKLVGNVATGPPSPRGLELREEVQPGRSAGGGLFNCFGGNKKQ
jgi:hypothetical protein